MWSDRPWAVLRSEGKIDPRQPAFGLWGPRGGIKDGTEAALINLNQSKAFDRFDHRFLASVLETAGCKSEFCRWISMMYHNPQRVVQVNEKRSEVFVLERSVRQDCSMSLLYVLALEPLPRRLRHEGANLALRWLMISPSLFLFAWT